MTRILAALAIAICLTGPLAQPAAAQSTEDAAGIEAAIRAQLDAFQADDWEQAFSFASPAIQGMFHDPETFSRMVTDSYPMVWRPKGFSVGALSMSPRGLKQTVIFEDRNGRFHIADYFMQMIDGAWRINGVSIRPAPEQNA